MWRLLYWLTLPFFLASYGGALGLEAVCWLVLYPRDAWNFIKRALGIVK